MRVMAENHRDMGDDQAAAEAAGEQAAKRAAEELVALETEMAAAGATRQESDRRIRQRRKALRQQFKKSQACGYWYDEYDFDNDCWNAWNSAGTDERVRHLESLLTGHSAQN